MQKIKIIILLSVTVLVNIASNFLQTRIDLTQEGRYTLSSVTTRTLNSLDSTIVIETYLKGNLNSGFERLRKSTQEMIDEYTSTAKRGMIIKRETDPHEMTESSFNKFNDELEVRGLGGIPVYETKEDGTKNRQVVYPYAHVQMGNKDIWIELLENIQGLSAEDNLNRSIEGLEYKLTNAIVRLSNAEKQRIAFIEGHGELDEIDVIEAADALAQNFAVDRGAINGNMTILDPYKAIIIAKPMTKFSEADKYVLDQYIMRGGKVFWLIDQVGMTLDSLQNSAQTVGLMAEYNLDDMLFIYGIRFNPIVVEDMNCGVIGVSVNNKIVPMPWRFMPLLSANNNNPITRNISYVRGDFTSTLDTVGEELKLKRTPLLRTSAYTKVNRTPVMAQLSTIHNKPQQQEFGYRHLNVAMLSEGVFNSAFAHRPIPKGVVNANAYPKLDESVPTAMVFTADGDIIRNTVRLRESPNPQIIPLGYCELSRQTFGNRQFVVSAIEKLADDNGLIELRNRSFRLRLLNKKLIAEGTTSYKIMAIAIPMGIITLIGLALLYLRRRKYAIKQ